MAYAIAERAHRGDMREKKAGNIIYITHPVMVCKLMHMMGKADDLNLAIALLHDVIEDCEPYKSRPQALREELYAGLKQEGYSDRGASNISTTIFDHCLELSHNKDGDELSEGKRTFQVIKAHGMTDRSKFIKILDQTASVMDDIFYESSRPKQVIERFAMKALNVVKAASRGGTPDILRAEHTFKSYFRYLMNLHKANPATDEAMRKNFDPQVGYNRAFVELRNEMAKKYERMLMSQEAKVTGAVEVLHPGITKGEQSAMPQSGCIGLFLVRDSEGDACVSSYDCLIDRASGNDDGVPNRAAMYLLGTLESFATHQHVEIGESSAPNGELLRNFIVEPPIKLTKFLEATRTAETMVRGYVNDAASLNVGALPRHPVLDNRMEQMIRAIENEAFRDTQITH